MSNADLDLAPSVLAGNIDAAVGTLGASLSHREWNDAAPNGRVIARRTIDGSVSNKNTRVHARFVHQGIVELAKKVFVDEVEVGVSDFDDEIYVVTDTRDETARLLETPRVRDALVRLVGRTGSVEVDGGKVHVEHEDPPSTLDDARAEVVAILAHL